MSDREKIINNTLAHLCFEKNKSIEEFDTALELISILSELKRVKS